MFGFLEPNGAGKSTTIRHMMGFSKPGSGEVKIFGEPTCGFDPVMQERFVAFIHEKKRRGKTILLSIQVIPQVVRLDALNYFNYTTIISMFDVVSIMDGSVTFIRKFAILAALGIIGIIAGFVKFIKKDLPQCSVLYRPVRHN